MKPAVLWIIAFAALIALAAAAAAEPAGYAAWVDYYQKQGATIVEKPPLLEITTKTGEKVFRYIQIPDTTSTKNPEEYTKNTVFLIPDITDSGESNWRDILMLLSATIWVGNSEDRKWCDQVFDQQSKDDFPYTPKCAYPMIVYHKEWGGADLDAPLHFLSRYPSGQVINVGSLKQSGHILPALAQQNKDIVETDISQLFSYWKNYTEVLLVKDDYALAMQAAQYAVYKNIPLVIEGTKLDTEKTYVGKRLVCIEAFPKGKDASACDSFMVEATLRESLLSLTSSDKAVFVNPNDINNDYCEMQSYSTKTAALTKSYCHDSLAAPYLAAAEEQVIVPLDMEPSYGMWPVGGQIAIQLSAVSKEACSAVSGWCKKVAKGRSVSVDSSIKHHFEHTNDNYGSFPIQAYNSHIYLPYYYNGARKIDVFDVHEDAITLSQTFLIPNELCGIVLDKKLPYLTPSFYLHVAEGKAYALLQCVDDDSKQVKLLSFNVGADGKISKSPGEVYATGLPTSSDYPYYKFEMLRGKAFIYDNRFEDDAYMYDLQSGKLSKLLHEGAYSNYSFAGNNIAVSDDRAFFVRADTAKNPEKSRFTVHIYNSSGSLMQTSYIDAYNYSVYSSNVNYYAGSLFWGDIRLIIEDKNGGLKYPSDFVKLKGVNLARAVMDAGKAYMFAQGDLENLKISMVDLDAGVTYGRWLAYGGIGGLAKTKPEDLFLRVYSASKEWLKEPRIFNYFTFIGSPKAIQLSDRETDAAQVIDLSLVESLLNWNGSQPSLSSHALASNTFMLKPTGRIFGLTVSDSSVLSLRSIFSKKLERGAKNKLMVIIGGDIEEAGFDDNTLNIIRFAESKGFSHFCYYATSGNERFGDLSCADPLPQKKDYETSDVIGYDMHGSPKAAATLGTGVLQLIASFPELLCIPSPFNFALDSRDIIGYNLDLPVVYSQSCSNLDYYHQTLLPSVYPPTVGTSFIRSGAVAFYGSPSISYGYDQNGVLTKLLKGSTVGESVCRSNGNTICSSYQAYINVLIGDPTYKPYPQSTTS